MTRRHEGNTETTRRRIERRRLAKIFKVEAREECEDLMRVCFGLQGLDIDWHEIMLDPSQFRFLTADLTNTPRNNSYTLCGKHTHKISIYGNDRLFSYVSVISLIGVTS